MRKIIIVFNILFAILFKAQSGSSNNSYIPTTTPLSPNSSSFEKYGIVPVNLSAGVITPSIPLFSIPIGTNSFNVNLNYSSQGIRVDEHPTNVGMGWSLNLGSITRSLRDLPDESSTRISNLGTISGNDYFYIGNILTNDPTIDSETDVFNVNIDGYSTKFILDSDSNQNITIKKLKIDNIKVELLVIPALLSEDFSLQNKIRITTPNGTKYYFGGNNGVERTFSRPHNVPMNPPIVYTNAWLLSKIEYIDGNVLNINYQHKILTYTDGINQTALIKFNVPTEKDSGLPQLIPANTHLSYNRVHTAIPISIQSNDTLINFETTTFADYLQDFPKINSISIYSLSNLIKKINFNYNSYESIENGKNNFTIKVKRPFLEKLSFDDKISNKVSEYDFEYFSPNQMPDRFSFSQDLLGYYNGANNKNFIFNSLKDYNYFPDHYIIKNNGEELNNFLFNVSGNRKPNIIYSKLGALKKIIYPTKGFTEFEYQGNLTDVREMIFPPYVDFSMEIVPNAETNMNVQKEIFFSVPFDQKLYVKEYQNTLVNVDPESSICEPDPVHHHGSLSIYDDTNNTVDRKSVV